MITYLFGVACGLALRHYWPVIWAYINKKGPQ